LAKTPKQHFFGPIRWYTNKSVQQDSIAHAQDIVFSVDTVLLITNYFPRTSFVLLLQILVLAIFFGQTITDAGLQVMGLILAIIGLTLFLDGLRVSIMVR